MADRVNLLDLSLPALTEWFAAQGEKPFRARQVFQWIHQRGVDDFDAMWNAALRRLGLNPRGDAEDSEMVVKIFAFLHQSQIGYEQFWFDWRGGTLSSERATRSPVASAYSSEAFEPVRAALAPYEATTSVNLDHPYFTRTFPRTMLWR